MVGGSKSAKGGPYPLADLDRGGPNPLADMDRGSKSAGGSKSAVTPALKSVELSISLKKKECGSSGNIFVSPALLCRLGVNQVKSYINTPLKSFGFFDIKGLSKTFFPVKF